MGLQASYRFERRQANQINERNRNAICGAQHENETTGWEGKHD